MSQPKKTAPSFGEIRGTRAGEVWRLSPRIISHSIKNRKEIKLQNFNSLQFIAVGDLADKKRVRTFRCEKPVDLAFYIFGVDYGYHLKFRDKSAFAEHVRVDRARAFRVKPERLELVALKAGYGVAKRNFRAHVARRNVERKAFGLRDYSVRIFGTAHGQRKNLFAPHLAERALMRNHDIRRVRSASDENTRRLQCF